MADASVTAQKIADNTITPNKLADDLKLLTAVQLLVTSNVNIYSASLIFYETVNDVNVAWGMDIPVFMPFIDGGFFNNVSGVINVATAYTDEPKELTGYGLLHLHSQSAIKARLVLNLRSTGLNNTSTLITPKIMFRDGHVNEYQQPIQGYEAHNINAKSNYLTVDFDVDTNIYTHEGFKIWIKVESSII